MKDEENALLEDRVLEELHSTALNFGLDLITWEVFLDRMDEILTKYKEHLIKKGVSK